MALISAFTLIRAISLFHITAAYFFLASPATITDQNVVFIIGASMRLPQPTALSKAGDSNAFIAVLLAFFGVADLVAASLSDLVALEYWLSNVPVYNSLRDERHTIARKILEHRKEEEKEE
ncbi:hypothetical protein AMS68_005399 [Peltaster fructicola]|uniref:Uncharacterized protein n=1 Tax=Peltaster fructicola TaxID=286661 RepID=A0A6H0XYN1_9PEZI|nr:hypothetical protein AMS68_005399 [Peltaster fructicola]